MTTPLERAILTHYWVSPGPWKEGSDFWKPADCEAVDKFVELGLLKKVSNDMHPGTTYTMANDEALAPYMEALAAVPLPVQRWVIPK